MPIFRIPSLAALIGIASIAPVFAVTEADITPAALVGKTLTFTVSDGSAPLPATGSWTGTFAASGNGFVVGDISSGTPPLTTTYTASQASGITSVYVTQFGAAQDVAYIYLFLQNGMASYYCQAFAGTSEGTFTIGTPSAGTPEINVRQQKQGDLTDGKAKIGFGTVRVGKSGAALKFTLTNSGDAPLEDLAIILDGRNKAEFIASPLKRNQLAGGESLEFTVKFKPGGSGTRKATLRIRSNDADEDPFDIGLSGTGKSAKGISNGSLRAASSR